MRGFEIGAKEGSACAGWLAARGIASIRNFANSDAVVNAARAGDIRVFCMDSRWRAIFFTARERQVSFANRPPVQQQFPLAVRGGQTRAARFHPAGF